MALDPVVLAALLKSKTKDKVQATLPDGITMQNSDSIDAYFAGIAEAIIEHIQTSAEVQPSTLVVGVDAVTGTGTIS